MATSEINKILESLNKEQYEAVTADIRDGPIEIIAGPGTGKTKVLTSKIVYLLIEQKIPPENILVTTFTKNAANEMIDRIESLLTPGSKVDPKKLIIGTFHSICVRILRKYGTLIGLTNFRIADTKDSNAVLKTCLQKMTNENEELKSAILEKDFKQYRQIISNLKSKLKIPIDKKNQSIFDRVFWEYQERLRILNLLDFDDLLLLTHELLEKFPHILNFLQCILVDEFQDTSNLQLELLYKLASNTAYDGITVVGDPDQGIYGFRNAIPQNFEYMKDHYGQNTRIFYLNENYRSTTDILDFSNDIMKNDKSRFVPSKKLRSQLKLSFKPVLRNFKDEKAESQFISNEILYLTNCLPGTIYHFLDIAVLIRSSSQSRRIEEAFISLKIPYIINKGISFWERKEVSTIMDYLRVIVSDMDILAISRTINYPPRGVGDKTLTNIENLINSRKTSHFDTIKDCSKGRVLGISKNVMVSIKFYTELIEDARKVLNSDSYDTDNLNGDEFDSSKLINVSCSEKKVIACFDFIVKQCGIEAYIKHSEKDESKSEDRIKNIVEVRNELISFVLNDKVAIDFPDFIRTESTFAYNIDSKTSQNENDGSTKSLDILIKFIESVDLYAIKQEKLNYSNVNDSNDKFRPRGKVTISTIHSSKGLEWPVVYLPTLNDGSLPSNMSIKQSMVQASLKNFKASNPIDEERRIFYVAITRAKELLLLSHTNYMNNFSFSGPNKITRFFNSKCLKNCDEKLQIFNSKDTISKLYELKCCNNKLAKIDSSFIKQIQADYTRFSRNPDSACFYFNSSPYGLITFDNLRKVIKAESASTNSKKSSLKSFSGFVSASSLLKRGTSSDKLKKPAKKIKFSK